MSQSIDTLLINGLVLTMNDQYDIILDGAVAIHQEKIIAVGTTDHLTTTYTATNTIDCTHQLIMPGLVNAHTHIPMSLLRGLNDDLRLDVWLGYLMPLEREFVTPEFVRLGTRLACAEMIRSGITCFADMYYFEADIAAETAHIGMRGLLGQTILRFPAPDAQSYEDGLTNCRRFIEEWQNHPLIQPAVAPHAWYTATPELLRAAADLARAYDVPLHTHVSESLFEINQCQEENHQNVVSWLDKHGILDTKLLAAHCVHIDSQEMYQLEQAGAGIAHCPSSNLKLASGIANLHEMLAANLHVGVGTDGPASNNDLDMFEEFRLAALLAKTKSNDPTVVPAKQAVTMATRLGAKAVHMGDKIGSLEPHKLADIIIVDMNGLHNWPHFHNNPENVYSRLVYAAKSTDVAHVICHGRFLMRDRQLLTIDEAATQTEAAQVAATIDAFVQKREANPYNKLVALAGRVERGQSFEIQIKIPITPDQSTYIEQQINQPDIEIIKKAHYRQYDAYLLFDKNKTDITSLRYREDEYINDKGETYQERTRLTLISEDSRETFPNTTMLSHSRFLSPAQHSLRFYREYFAPQQEVAVHKDRRRWRLIFQDTEFAVNLDQLIKPQVDTPYLEIKARTWSRDDAYRKADLIADFLTYLGLNTDNADTRDYLDIAQD
ncbi:MAG TPA: amidohydrolase [Anaerolineae bacterium]|nr:amidohydrolase [Anaerolineae bacterium]